jgi:uncharacterized protein (UPF0147 family)
MPLTALSSPIQRDGDTQFLGLQSRRNPIAIPSGYLQASSNVRLDRGIAQTRSGAQRLAQGISAAGTPVTVPFALASSTISTVSQTGNIATATTTSAHNLLPGYQILISGVGISNYNGTFIVLTTPTSTTFTYAVSGSPASSTGGSAKYPVVQSSYVSGIYAAGVYSSPRLDNTNEYVVLAGTTQAYLWRYSSSGPTVITKSYPTSPIAESIQPGDRVNIVQAFDQLFLFRWRSSEPMQSVTSITQSSGSTTATITMPSAHGFNTGEVVRLSGSSVSVFNLDAVVTVTSSTTFTITLPSAASNLSDTSSYLFAQRVCCPLVWDGSSSTNFVRVPTGSNALGPTYSNLIAPYNAIATYYNNQLLIAGGRDSVLISDVLNPFNFDPLNKSFRTNVGSNDYLVALHPYANGQAIAFLRKSIYLGTIVLNSDGVTINTTNSSLQLLTNEIGCNARQTVATAGLYIYFLSDNGVYRLDNSQIDLALRGNTLPLSEPIADIMATINAAYVYISQGIYFNNRYYLAVPTNGSTTNNTLLIYNQLNEAWESVDTYPFSLDRLVISDYVTSGGTQRRLYAASSTGLLYLLEQYTSGVDDAATGAATVGVTGSITTRRYFYGQLNHKRLNSVTVSSFLPAGSTVNVTAITTDRDSTTQVVSVLNSSADNDYTIKAPIRRVAEYLDVQISTMGGRPTIRAVSADAAVTMDPSRLARTES